MFIIINELLHFVNIYKHYYIMLHFNNYYSPNNKTTQILWHTLSCGGKNNNSNNGNSGVTGCSTVLTVLAVIGWALWFMGKL